MTGAASLLPHQGGHRQPTRSSSGVKVGKPADLRLELLSDCVLVVCPAAEALEKQCGSVKECGTTRWLGGEIMQTFALFFMYR